MSNFNVKMKQNKARTSLQKLDSNIYIKSTKNMQILTNKDLMNDL